MGIMGFLFTDTFSIKRTEQVIDTSGNVTRVVVPIALNLQGRFESLTSSRLSGFVGQAVVPTVRLFTDFNELITKECVIVNDADGKEFTIERMDPLKTLTDHHLELYLSERSGKLG